MKKNGVFSLIAASITVSICWVCWAGTTLLTGTEKPFWKNHSIVVGSIQAIDQKILDEEGRFSATLHVDEVLHTWKSMKAEEKITIDFESLSIPPGPQDPFIVVLVHDAQGKWTIPSYGINFMPEGKSIIPLRQTGDTGEDTDIAQTKMMNLIRESIQETRDKWLASYPSLSE